MPPMLRSRSVLATLVLAAACGGGGGGGNTSAAPTAPVTQSTTPSTTPTTTPTTSTTPATNEVVADDANTFNPGTLTVSKGTTVTFTFKGTAHNVTFGNTTGAPANIPNSSNTSVARTFATAGTFGYDCTLHAGMRGSVVVN